MNPDEINAALSLIRAESDPATKALLLAGLTSRLFREAGFQPVVVGGSAIEFYTDGAYMSGDIDICWSGPRVPTPVEQARVLQQLSPESGSSRTCRVAGLFLDLLTAVEGFARTGFSRLATPLGELSLMPIEDLLAERVFIARCWTGRNDEAEACVRKLIAVALAGDWPVDWVEAERVAALPAYQCLEQLMAIRCEVSAALAQTGKATP